MTLSARSAISLIKLYHVTLASCNSGVRILDDKGPLIYQKKHITIHLAADHFPELKDDDTVVFKYIPIRENSEYSMNWEITKEVYDAHNESSSGSGSSEAPEPDASTTA